MVKHMEAQSQKNRYESIKEFVFNYPDGDNLSSWVSILHRWLVKNKDKLFTKSNKVITTTYVMQKVKSFNNIMLNDIWYNHVIFAFPNNKFFLFIAQLSENS